MKPLFSAMLCTLSLLVTPALAQERLYYVAATQDMRSIYNSPGGYVLSMLAKSATAGQPHLQIDLLCEKGKAGLVRFSYEGTWPAATGTATLTLLTTDSSHTASVKEHSQIVAKSDTFSTLEFSPSDRLSPFLFGVDGVFTLRLKTDVFDQEYLVLPLFDNEINGERVGGHLTCH